MSEYLTEAKLELYLKNIFPNTNIIRDRIVPNSGIKNRPDFRIDELMLIVEFDGYGHYTKPKTILTDNMKDTTYQNMGYTVVRIPYFIQWSKELVKSLFGIDTTIKQTYPHGFIDKKAPLPAEFCSLGLEKFNEDLNKFSFAKNDILISLKNKIDSGLDYLLVYPLNF